ncbi:ribosomal protein S5 domain 2-like protein [Ramaria rubella]|nr:ribosomal protein S5 domain 2-like protein [Ramaria rubella]
MSLDSFVKTSRPLPQPVCTSRSIQDRDSTFVASLFRIASPATAYATAKHVKTISHATNPASCEMMAYRIMSLKPGHTGLHGPEDFEVKGGSEDDGEKYGGGRILKIMQREGVLDVVVIVSRWYGGTLLGPVRFTHIENCTLDVCVRFKVIEEIEGYVQHLHTLDEKLKELRTILGNDGNPTSTSKKSQDYSSLITTSDVTKARRLIKARESAVKTLEGMITNKRELSQVLAAKTQITSS